MKKILLLATAIALILISCKDTAPEEITFLGIATPFYRVQTTFKGKVKSMKVRTYWAKEVDGKIEKGDIISRVERDSLNYMSDWNLELDENGLPTRLEYIMYDGKINHWEALIDDKKIVKNSFFRNGEPINYNKFIYDEAGLFTEGKYYRSGIDTLLTHSNLTYLENGNLDRVYGYNYLDKMYAKDEFIWKNEDQVSEYRRYNGDDELVYTMKMEYDEDGDFVSMTFDYPGVRHTKYEYKDIKYDEMGNMVSGVAYKNDTLFSITDYLIEYYQE